MYNYIQIQKYRSNKQCIFTIHKVASIQNAGFLLSRMVPANFVKASLLYLNSTCRQTSSSSEYCLIFCSQINAETYWFFSKFIYFCTKVYLFDLTLMSFELCITAILDPEEYCIYKYTHITEWAFLPPCT